MRKRNRIPGVSKRVLQDGTVHWRAVVDVGEPGDRRQVGRTFATQAEAIDWRAEMKTRRRRGEVVEPSVMPLRDYAQEWLEIRAVRVHPNTIHAYRCAYGMVDGSLGSLGLAQITPTRIERAYASLNGHYAPSTMRNAHRALKSILATAVRDGLIMRNPAERVDPPGKAPEPKPIWTLAQTRTFLQSLDDGDPHADAWRLILEVWLRNGELRALSWKSVDLDRALVHVVVTATRDKDQRPVVGKPKTASSVRCLPISADLVERLRDRRRGQQERAMRLGIGWSDTRFVFPGRGGDLLNSDTLRKAFTLACHRAAVPDISVHGLRHTGISLAYAERVLPKVISERAGHSSTRITQDIYAHIDPEQHVQLADLMGELLAV
jgi:integrase